MFCTHCNYKLQHGWNFCPRCNTAINKTVAKELENETKNKLWGSLQKLNKEFKGLNGETVVEYGLIGAKFVTTRKEHICENCRCNIKAGDFALTSSMSEVLETEFIDDKWHGTIVNTKRSRPTRIYRCLKCSSVIIRKANQLDKEISESKLHDIDYEEW